MKLAQFRQDSGFGSGRSAVSQGGMEFVVEPLPIRNLQFLFGVIVEKVTEIVCHLFHAFVSREMAAYRIGIQPDNVIFIFGSFADPENGFRSLQKPPLVISTAQGPDQALHDSRVF
jgi:hypothetical protein